jgi:UDP:flavonoid glycosyltransferase YjiC (YdhE family)
LLFTTVPLRGHFFPLVPLAWAARAAGHEVLVATSDNFVPTVLQSGLPAASCGPAVDFVDLMTDRFDDSAHDSPRRRYAHGRAFGRIAARCLPGTRALVEAWRPDLVVSERAEFSGPLAATVNDVPYVEYQWGVAPLDEYRHAAAAELAGELTAMGRSDLPTPAEVLNPWPPAMRLPHAVAHHSVRDVAYNGAARVSGWILQPRARPRVCVTFGTVVPRLRTPRLRDIVVPTLERLARLDVELLVAADDEVVAGWPDLPASVSRVGRLPLAQVLPTSDLVVNHGGQGTVLTALVAGCPQLVLPQFDDQFDNARALVKAGAGLSLPPDEVTPALVAEHCRELLADARFAGAAARVAAEIADQPSPAEVVDLLGKLA